MLLAILNASGGGSASASNVLRLQNTDTTATGSTDAFLASKLTFKQDEYGQEICVVKSGDEEVGVMMGWETPIMEETVRALCPIDRPGLKVLNVGFGLGIVGLFFSRLRDVHDFSCLADRFALPVPPNATGASCNNRSSSRRVEAYEGPWLVRKTWGEDPGRPLAGLC